MPRPTYLDYDPPTRDADGIAETQATATAGTVTLNGALCDLGTAARFDIGDSYPTSIAGVKLRINSATEGVNFTFTGLNQHGQAITEVLAGAAGSPATDTVQYFSRLTSVTTSGQADGIQIGVSHGTVSKAVPLNWRNHEAATYAIYEVDYTAGDLTGTTIWEYFGDFQHDTGGFATDGWVNKVTTATEGATVGTLGARAVRVSMATHGTEFQFAIVQN